MSDTHLPMRPSWNCGGCGALWPCVSKRRSLLAEFEDAPISLCCLLAGLFVDACCDLPAVPAGVLHWRFFGWTEHLRSRGAPAVDRLPAEQLRRAGAHRFTAPGRRSPGG